MAVFGGYFKTSAPLPTPNRTFEEGGGVALTLKQVRRNRYDVQVGTGREISHRPVYLKPMWLDTSCVLVVRA